MEKGREDWEEGVSGQGMAQEAGHRVFLRQVGSRRWGWDLVIWQIPNYFPGQSLDASVYPSSVPPTEIAED